MFEKDIEELKSLGADITTVEIKQQPDLWRDAYNIYRENKAAVEEFLADLKELGRVTVVFAGAGTSDYVGDTVAPYLRHAGDTDAYNAAAELSDHFRDSGDASSSPHKIIDYNYF